MRLLDTIKSAYRIAGLIADTETPSAEMAATGLAIFNRLMSQWRNEYNLGYCFKTYEFALANEKQTYTIGSGGDWNISDRPIKIHAAKVIYEEGAYEVLIEDATADRIIKTGVYGIPDRLWYNADWPLGHVILFPIPNVSGATIVLVVKAPISKAMSVQEDIDLPDGYDSLLTYSIAVDACMCYGLQPNPLMLKRYNELRGLIKGNNAQEAIMAIDMFAKGTSFNIYNGY